MEIEEVYLKQKQDVPFLLKIDKGTKERLQELSKLRKIPMSNLIRFYLTKALDEELILKWKKKLNGLR